MDIEFKEPWISVGEFASSLAQELRLEATEGHPLWNVKAFALARRLDSDDVLFAVELDGRPPQYAVVRLTWRGGPEPDTRWPNVERYGSLDEWVRDRMTPDHVDFARS